MGKTSIEWTQGDDGAPGRTWNPIRGCSLTSAGCTHCYAMKFAHRFSGEGKPYEGLTKLGANGPIWTGKVRLVPELLGEPFRWQKPARVFVNSMSDLFHESVPFDYIDQVFAVMAVNPKHTFQILTKRARRMADYFADRSLADAYTNVLASASSEGAYVPSPMDKVRGILRIYDSWEVSDKQPKYPPPKCWPLPNVWLGVSVEDQAAAVERIPNLLKVPAVVRFLSVEPLLSAIDLRKGIYFHPGHDVMTWEVRGTTLDGIHWVICGGESGPGARGFDVRWARSLRDQCQAAGTPFFMKQMGADVFDTGSGEGTFADEWPDGTSHTFFEGDDTFKVWLRDKKGGDPSEWPDNLRVRQFPTLEPATP